MPDELIIGVMKPEKRIIANAEIKIKMCLTLLKM
jgi:hypothetical protein